MSYYYTNLVGFYSRHLHPPVSELDKWAYVPDFEKPWAIKVAEHSFSSLWIYVICQIMAREGLQLTSCDWRVKFDIFVASMTIWTIEYNLKVSLLLSLHKIHSLDFPINLYTAYYNINHYHLTLIWPNFNRRVFR